MLEQVSKLQALWRDRDKLSESEWEELYREVFRVLTRCTPRILSSLPESRTHYIQDFFLLKVFEPARRQGSELASEHALCAYFKNFLLDVHRGLKTDGQFAVLDDLQHNPACTDSSLAHIDHEFDDHGLTIASVMEMAHRFLERLDEVSRAYLALHACSDTPIPLYKLAKELRISSYHYRAADLGITRRKGEFNQAYRNTRIGSWLVDDLGLELNPADPAILSALKILCLQSLHYYQHVRSDHA